MPTVSGNVRHWGYSSEQNKKYFLGGAYIPEEEAIQRKQNNENAESETQPFLLRLLLNGFPNPYFCFC